MDLLLQVNFVSAGLFWSAHSQTISSCLTCLSSCFTFFHTTHLHALHALCSHQKFALLWTVVCVKQAYQNIASHCQGWP